VALFDKFRRKHPPCAEQTQEVGAQPAIPDGTRLYCIGDIHGRADLLDQLHAMIQADAAGYAGEKQIVYLGDYIDRGADSKRVVDILLQQNLPGFVSTFLLGNHEQTLLEFLIDPHAMASWLVYGGVAMLQSYGIEPGLVPSRRDLGRIRDDLDAALPDSHRKFFEQCTLCHMVGSYYFVHAGIRPGIALDKQLFEDQIWIRDAFTTSEADHGVVVVHGHCISSDAEFRPNRIGIDTGAFNSGVLTALVLEGTDQRLLQTGLSN